MSKHDHRFKKRVARGIRWRERTLIIEFFGHRGFSPNVETAFREFLCADGLDVALTCRMVPKHSHIVSTRCAAAVWIAKYSDTGSGKSVAPPLIGSPSDDHRGA
jgi:hypothetical protein